MVLVKKIDILLGFCLMHDTLRKRICDLLVRKQAFLDNTNIFFFFKKKAKLAFFKKG